MADARRRAPRRGQVHGPFPRESARPGPRHAREGRGPQPSRRSASLSSDPVIKLGIDAAEQLLQNLNHDQDDQWRKIDSPEIGQNSANGSVKRSSYAIERDGKRPDTVRACVEDVEGEKPA